MENAADALKIVLAIVIFGLGLTLLFNMSSQAKETARILISESDPTKYYSYYDEEDVEDKIDLNGNRIVELKDIIPALYRYSQENYGVTIVDKNGEIVARFDLDTEQACNNWPRARQELKENFIIETYKTFEKANALAERLNGNKIDTRKFDVSKSKRDGKDYYEVKSIDGMTTLFGDIYGQETSLKIRREYYCYWSGTLAYTVQRVDSDLSRNKCTF